MLPADFFLTYQTVNKRLHLSAAFIAHRICNMTIFVKCKSNSRMTEIVANGFNIDVGLNAQHCIRMPKIMYTGVSYTDLCKYFLCVVIDRLW